MESGKHRGMARGALTLMAVPVCLFFGCNAVEPQASTALAPPEAIPVSLAGAIGIGAVAGGASGLSGGLASSMIGNQVWSSAVGGLVGGGVGGGTGYLGSHLAAKAAGDPSEASWGGFWAAVGIGAAVGFGTGWISGELRQSSARAEWKRGMTIDAPEEHFRTVDEASRYFYDHYAEPTRTYGVSGKDMIEFHARPYGPDGNIRLSETHVSGQNFDASVFDHLENPRGHFHTHGPTGAGEGFSVPWDIPAHSSLRNQVVQGKYYCTGSCPSRISTPTGDIREITGPETYGTPTPTTGGDIVPGRFVGSVTMNSWPTIWGATGLLVGPPVWEAGQTDDP